MVALIGVTGKNKMDTKLVIASPSDTVKLSDYLDYEKLITNCKEYKWMIS